MMNIQGFGTITKEEIIEFEKETGFVMPEDYRSFLEKNNGGVLQGDNNYITVDTAKEDIMLDVLFGIGKDIKKDFNIRYWLKEFEGEIPKTVIIIGTPVGGGLVLLANGKWKKGVYFWDNTFELMKSNRFRCIYKMANTFTEFVGKIRD